MALFRYVAVRRGVASEKGSGIVQVVSEQWTTAGRDVEVKQCGGSFNFPGVLGCKLTKILQHQLTVVDLHSE